jgi:hypothetical protein
MSDLTNDGQVPWWVAPVRDSAVALPQIRAIAYYRHSAQDRQENSVVIQQEQVQQWARDNGVIIIHEFADRGKSGLTAEGRDAFTDMMENWVKQRQDFQYVLCLDVSRWGRFQDINMRARRRRYLGRGKPSSVDVVSMETPCSAPARSPANHPPSPASVARVPLSRCEVPSQPCISAIVSRCANFQTALPDADRYALHAVWPRLIEQSRRQDTS